MGGAPPGRDEGVLQSRDAVGRQSWTSAKAGTCSGSATRPLGA